MAKKINFESFRYRFLITARDEPFLPGDSNLPSWTDFIRSLEFIYEKGDIRILWCLANQGSLSAALDGPQWRARGDTSVSIDKQKARPSMGSEDPEKLYNDQYFRNMVRRVAAAAGYRLQPSSESRLDGRYANEQAFHDAWAESTDESAIDVRAVNEACTAPEIRHIVHALGDVKGKRMLDVGCGLGEVSVYFSLLGADVSSCDLSSGMLAAACRLAEANGVHITPHVVAAEDLQLPGDAQFDIIYAGNLLHHVDIQKTLERLKRHLAPGGTLVTWDPLAYNPVINVYRRMASKVRTPDEHPLTWSDIRKFKAHFGDLETRYFWLTTLLIFVIMALVQRRHPSQERYWKAVVAEADKWRWLYQPLEALDRVLLTVFPPLRLLCWNVVIIARSPT